MSNGGPERQKSMSALMSAIGGRADLICSALALSLMTPKRTSLIFATI